MDQFKQLDDIHDGAGKPYVDKTGTMDKPDPMNYVFLEFPRAMRQVALVGQFGSKKHARRGWATLEPKFGIEYHLSKVGRHYLGRELEGEVNHADDDLLHAAQAAWNALAVLENVCKLRDIKPFTVPGCDIDADMAASARGAGR